MLFLQRCIYLLHKTALFLPKLIGIVAVDGPELHIRLLTVTTKSTDNVMTI